MPTFASYNEQFDAKGRVVRDGDVFTTDSSNGHTVASFPTSFNAWASLPTRTGTGVWKLTLRDPAFRILCVLVKALTTTANYVDVIMQPVTANTAGQAVVNWTFVTAGTTTAADIAASQQFEVFVVYSEASIA
jgi:hypothetical protein